MKEDCDEISRARLQMIRACRLMSPGERAKLSPAQLNALVSRVSKDVDARVQIDEKTLLGNFTLSYAGVVGHDSLDPSWRNHKDLQELREIFHRCKAKIQSSSVPPLGEYMQFFRKVDEDSERLIDSLLIQFGVDKKLMFRRISTYDLKVRELLK